MKLNNSPSGPPLSYLLCQLLGLGLLQLGHLGGGLVPQAAAAPVLADLLAALVKVGLHLNSYKN